MKNEKINGKQIRTILMLVSVFLFVYVYFFIYDDFNTKTEEIKSEQESVERQIAERKQQIEEAGSLEEQIAEIKEKMQTIYVQYPSKLTLVDVLLFLKTFEAENQLDMISISVGNVNEFYSTTVPKVEEELTGEYITGVRDSIQISFQGTYEQMKSCLDYLNHYEYRSSIDSISMAYDNTTGLVNGAMTMNLYAMEGNGVPYEVPIIDHIDLGKKIIFDTVQ